MKIGIDCRSLIEKKTGIGVYLSQILCVLNDIDSKNEYYLYSASDIVLDFKLNSNFKKCIYPYKHIALWYYTKLHKIIKKDKIDVFWGPQHELPKKVKNIKYLLTVHDLAIHKLKNIGERKNTIIQKMFLKKSCKQADKIIAVSQSTKKDIVDIFGINQNKIHVVYEGTNFDTNYILDKVAEREILKKFNIEDKNYIFFVSTIEPRKNIVTLIKAFENVKEKKKDDLKLILSGGLGWKYEEILEVIKVSKYQEDINLTGYISKEEKQCLMHNCKCFVYPSLYEGFGLPVLEAMANNAVVVTSNVSSLPEVGGEAALYFNNVMDDNELALKIEEAMNFDKNKRNKIIELGHLQVQKFDWKQCSKRTLMVIKSCVGDDVK